MKIVFPFLVAMSIQTVLGFAQQLPRFETLDFQTEYKVVKSTIRMCEIYWEPQRKCVLSDSLGRGCIIWVPSDSGHNHHQTIVFTFIHIENGICRHDLNARHAWQCHQTYPCGHTAIDHAYVHCSWLSSDPGALPLQSNMASDGKALISKESIHPTQIHFLTHAP